MIMIIDAINNKAKLENIIQDLKRKYIIQNPKTKEQALKPIPEKPNQIINDLSSAIGFIDSLIDLNNDYAKENQKNELIITKQAVQIGVQNAEIKKLKRINERLLKNVKI